MFSGFYFIYINKDHVITNDIVRQVTYIIYHYIIPDITADNRTVIESDRPAEIMKFQIIRFEYPNPHQSEKITMMDKFGQERIGNQYEIPVVCIIPGFF